MKPPEGRDSVPVTTEETVLSAAKMKLLLLLCLGLTLASSHKEAGQDVVTSNFDASKVGSMEQSAFGFGGSEARCPPGGQESLDILDKRGSFRPGTEGSCAMLKDDILGDLPSHGRDSGKRPRCGACWPVFELPLRISVVSPGQSSKRPAFVWYPLPLSRPIFFSIYCRLPASGIPFFWPQTPRKI